MEEFKIQQAFDKFTKDKEWKPYNRKVYATLFALSDSSGVLVNFEQKEGENILPMSLQRFLDENKITQEDFYNSESV